MLEQQQRQRQEDNDIDSFIKKVDAVKAAINDLKNGEINPDDVRIEGIPTDEERKQREIQRIAAEEKLAKEKAERKEKLKVEEKELWWRNAELICGSSKEKNEERILGDGSNDEESSSEILRMKNENKLRDMYSTEYSRWDSWEPSDPATRGENEDRARIEEKLKVSTSHV